MNRRWLCLAVFIGLIISNGFFAYKAVSLSVGLGYTQMNLESEYRSKELLARLSIDAKISRQRFYEVIRAGGFSGKADNEGATIDIGGSIFVFNNDILVDIK